MDRRPNRGESAMPLGAGAVDENEKRLPSGERGKRMIR